MIYHYCERNSYDFFGEPLNAVSNLFFLISATILLKKKNGSLHYPFLIFLIGTGSFFWHTIPNNLTAYLDVISILLFMIIYTFELYNNHIFKNLLLSLVFVFLFILICIFSGYYGTSSIFKTSSFYLPILLNLFFLNLYFYKKKIKNLYMIQICFFIFFISLTFRTLDFYFCNIFKYGFHFIWHFLNAILLYYLVRFLNLLSYRTSPKEPPKTNKKKSISIKRMFYSSNE